MQLSNAPEKVVLPFAASGGKNNIPVDSQIGITGGAASFADGFPPLTRTPVSAGGIPPSGLDMNGILFELSAVVRWANAGGGYAFDEAFAADPNVGGYPKGARVLRTDGKGYWFNTADNNTTDPESAGAAAAGWVPDFATSAAAVTMTNANVTLTPPQYGKPLIVITGLLTANLNLIFPAIAGQQWVVYNGTTGDFTLTLKTAAGSGVIAPQTFSAPVYSDGVDVFLTGSEAGQIWYKKAEAGAPTTDVAEELDLIKRLQPGDFDLSWLISKNGQKIVITGDSLSYNRYDFDATLRANAFDCFPGMMSWSFMLRDFIHRADPWFRHADALDYVGINGGQVAAFNSATAYVAPFNGRFVAVDGTGATSEVAFMIRANNEDSGIVALHCMNNSGPDAGLMDVYYDVHPYGSPALAGTLDSGGRTLFQGFEPFTFTAAAGSQSDYPIKIIIKNFRNRDGSPAVSTRRAYLCAVGTKSTQTYLTGAGGSQTWDIASDFAARIGNYAPDLLVMMLGANDRFHSTKESYAQGLVNLINQTRAARPYCQIVCMTTPPASDDGYDPPSEVRNGSTMRDFLETAKRAVLGAGAYWFDTYELFRGIDPTVWRFDNVHLTKRGNKMLFDAFVGRYFAAAYGSKEYYDPALVANNPKVFQEERRASHGFVSFQFSSGTNTYTITGSSDPDAVVKSVERDAVTSYRLKVSFNYSVKASLASGPQIAAVSLSHTGASSLWVSPRVAFVGDDYIEFFLFDIVSNSTLTDAMNNGQSYTLFF